MPMNSCLDPCEVSFLTSEPEFSSMKWDDKVWVIGWYKTRGCNVDPQLPPVGGRHKCPAVETIISQLDALKPEGGEASRGGWPEWEEPVCSDCEGQHSILVLPAGLGDSKTCPQRARE